MLQSAAATGIESQPLRDDEESGPGTPSSSGLPRSGVSGRAVLGLLTALGLVLGTVSGPTRVPRSVDTGLAEETIALALKQGLVAGGKCAKDYSDDCRNLTCCSEFTTCYEKSSGFAACKPTCAYGVPDEAPPWDPDATKEPWSCKVLGSRQKTPKWETTNSTPSLYCFLLALVMGSEPELLRRQLMTGSSIFGCNAYSLFSERRMVIGEGPNGTVETTAIGGPMKGAKQNRAEFLRAWQKACDLGIYKHHDWTVKVDPDTMFIPSKLRPKLARHNLAPAFDKLYFKNCEAYTSVQGPLEIFSQSAAKAFLEGLKGCQQKDWINQKGEDWFFGHCMDDLGVRFEVDYELLDDNYCGGQTDKLSCDDGKAAYHPLKTVKGYMECFEDNKK